jgi:hypothetical protein
VSGNIASREHEWSRNKLGEKPAAITVDFNELEMAFLRMESINGNIDALIAKFDSLDLCYDDLLNHDQRIAMKLCRVLNVSEAEIGSLRPLTIRQNPYPLESLAVSMLETDAN